MSRVRGALVVLAATVGLATLGVSAAAQAAVWVEGKELKAGESVKFADKATVGEAPVLEVMRVGIVIKCTGFGMPGTLLASGSGEVTFTLAGCKLESNVCTVGEALTSEAIAFNVTLGKKPEGTFAYRPVVGKVFFDIDFMGASCTIAGLQAIGGVVNMSAPNLQEELTEHELVAVPEEQESGMLFTGKFGLKLKSGKKWSIR